MNGMLPETVSSSQDRLVMSTPEAIVVIGLSRRVSQATITVSAMTPKPSIEMSASIGECASTYPRT